MKKIWIIVCLTFFCTSVFSQGCFDDQYLQVIKRSFDPNGDLGLSLIGPFYSGEKVTFEYTFEFDNYETRCAWFQSIIPTVFGPWRIYNPESTEITPLDKSVKWGWFPQNDIRYKLQSPSLCLKEDDQGQSYLIYNGDPSNVCDQPLDTNSILPSGWFATLPTADCDTTGHPNDSWGNITSCGVSTRYKFIFEMIVDDADSLDANIDYGVSINLFSFTDTEIGCWLDSVCMQNYPVKRYSYVQKAESFISSGFAANRTSICPGDSVVFDGISFADDMTYSWSFPGGECLDTTLKTPRVTYLESGYYPVDLTIEWDGQKKDYHSDQYIEVLPEEVEANMASVQYFGDFIRLSAIGDESFTKFKWLVDGRFAANTKTFDFRYNKKGVYQICLVANTICDSDTLCKKVDARERFWGDIDLGNGGVFTPKEEGLDSASRNSILDDSSIKSASVDFYPNPASSILFARSHDLDELDIAITNINGMPVGEYKLGFSSSETSIPLHLPDGVYLLSYEINSTRFIQKIVVLNR